MTADARHLIKTLALVKATRERRGKKLEDELRALDARHRQLLAARDEAQAELQRRIAMLQEHLAHERERLWSRKPTSVDVVLRGRARTETLEQARGQAEAAYAQACQAVEASDQARQAARRRIVQNDVRIESLEARRQRVRATMDRDSEDAEEEEREDAFTSRSAA